MTVESSKLETLLSKAQTIGTEFARLKVDYDKMTMKFSRELNFKMIETNRLLEKSKDFHLQHLVNI